VDQLEYVVVDVFTDQPFAGNPLAVFLDARDLSTDAMQAIARELNLSETTFVLPTETDDADMRLRIFTPGGELPTAGHPTVGSAFVLAAEGRLRVESGTSRVVFGQGVGPVPAEVVLDAHGTPVSAVMDAPLPGFGPGPISRTEAAALLSLEPDRIASDPPIEVGGRGAMFLYVPVTDVEALARARLRPDLWASRLAGTPAANVHVATPVTEDGVRARMFAPGLGVPEDPATGSASGPLAARFVRHGLLAPGGDGIARLQIGQGAEIGRPSRIEVEVRVEGAEVVGVRVGGGCALVARGTMRRPEAGR
jgi:trans-2,3-dihydro-3-hydroxyanthranilate isomerase